MAALSACWPLRRTTSSCWPATSAPTPAAWGPTAPCPFADANVLAAIRRDIVDPTLGGLQNEQFEFRGFLYFGIMLTPSGPKLLEYNARLGDPEAEVLLPALDSSLLDLIEATLDGTLAKQGVRQRPGAFVGVVLASGGYPVAGCPVPASPSPASTTCRPACTPTTAPPSTTKPVSS